MLEKLHSDRRSLFDAIRKEGTCGMSQLVVVIDDSPTVRKILEVSLHRAGYESVHPFSDALAFLRWLMTAEARIPSLLVVDVNLPQMDGYSLIQHLKTKPAFSQTVFVILTGRHGMLDRLKGRLSGAQVYLTKPFRTQDIIATIHTLLSPQAGNRAETASSCAVGIPHRDLNTKQCRPTESYGG